MRRRGRRHWRRRRRARGGGARCRGDAAAADDRRAGARARESDRGRAGSARCHRRGAHAQIAGDALCAARRPDHVLLAQRDTRTAQGPRLTLPLPLTRTRTLTLTLTLNSNVLPKVLTPLTRTWRPADSLRVVRERRWTSEHGPMVSRQVDDPYPNPNLIPHFIPLALALVLPLTPNPRTLALTPNPRQGCFDELGVKRPPWSGLGLGC